MNIVPADPQEFGERHIHFLPGAQAQNAALLRFRDPVASCAISASQKTGEETGHTFTVAVFPWGEAPEDFAAWTRRVADVEAGPPVYLKARGVEVWWCSKHAVLQCDAGEADVLVTALTEFEWYDSALRQLEVEIGMGWSDLESDKEMAFDVTAADLGRSHALGTRMHRAFQRRIDFARLEPHLYAADAHMTAAAQKLGNDLREKARFESRAEAMDAHMEVFEHIYEMASQRMGEFRAAHGSNRVEWIIIWLLVAEVTLSLVQVILRR